MKFLGLLLICLTLVWGCGRRTKTDEGKSLSEALMYLNAKDYEAAIPLFENLCRKHPQNLDYKIKLMHSYAGAGGFEALKVVKMAQLLEKSVFEFESFAPKEILPTLKTGLLPIPRLSDWQMNRISQAINIYQAIEPEFEQADKFNNMKWGMLHAFRLASLTKIFILQIEPRIEKKEWYRFDDSIKFLTVNFESIFNDASWTYKLLKHSYPKFQKVMIKIDDMVLEANPGSAQVYGQLIAQLNQQYQLVLNDLDKEYPEYVAELKKINIEDLLREANKAFNKSLHDGNLKPINEYLATYKNEWDSIIGAFNLYNEKHKVINIPKIEFPKIP